MKQEWTERRAGLLAGMVLLAGVLAGAWTTTAAVAQTNAAAPAKATAPALLGPAQTQKLLPPAVYFKGQSATTQIRNSGGVRFADGAYLLAVLVDTSGYSSEVAQKYQAYLITEDPIRIGGKPLPAGIYGVGFVANHQFVVMDVGTHELLTAPSQTDATMKRPRPLQITAASGTYRLYEGRQYVTVQK